MNLYHGSTHFIKGSLKPVLITTSPNHIHERAAVFATAREDIAALFMCPKDALFSIGFEHDVAYVCIWGTLEELVMRDRGGYLYVLSSSSFQKIGKAYEWQSFEPVMPIEVKHFDSALDGMMAFGVQVYFIDDEALMDRIVAEKENRTPILQMLVSENQRRNTQKDNQKKSFGMVQ